MKNLKFSDVAEFISDKVELSNLQKEQYISTENMLPNYGGIVEIDKLPKIEKCNKFKQGDILFSNIRTYFKKVWVAEFSGGCSPDVLIIRSKDENIVRTSYLYLLICSDDFINFTVASSNGAKMPRGDKNAIKNYIFNIPDIAFQDKAINTYFRFNKKITLNTQTNQTLEQIAQGIFKHWFIDFAPVHAKAEALARGETTEQAELAAMACLSGKTTEKITALKTQDPTAYHQLQQTAAAFPSEFVETEMGEVPKGWEILKFKDFVKETKEKVGKLQSVEEYSVGNEGIYPRKEKYKKQLAKDPSKNKLIREANIVFGMGNKEVNWGIMRDKIGSVSSAYNIFQINNINHLFLEMLINNIPYYFRDIIKPTSRQGQTIDKEVFLEKTIYYPNKD
ncbi:restriction endonuclease subunit S, partial [Avibacterium avium]|uniref:restriction endonuclease subunit S n=1 Tax=Avibacterium avium TaxID=751 RepID=UPI003BF88B47